MSCVVHCAWCSDLNFLRCDGVIVLMLRRAEAATNNSALVSLTWDFSLGKMRKRQWGRL